MIADYDYILSQYPSDQSIIKEFCIVNKSKNFDNYLHMIEEYNNYVENLNLTFISEEV